MNPANPISRGSKTTNNTRQNAGKRTTLVLVAALTSALSIAAPGNASYAGAVLVFEGGIGASGPVHIIGLSTCQPTGSIDGRAVSTCSFNDVEIRIGFTYESANGDVAGIYYDYQLNCLTCTSFRAESVTFRSLDAGGASGTYRIWVCDLPGSGNYGYCMSGSLVAATLQLW